MSKNPIPVPVPTDPSEAWYCLTASPYRAAFLAVVDFLGAELAPDPDAPVTQVVFPLGSELIAFSAWAPAWRQKRALSDSYGPRGRWHDPAKPKKGETSIVPIAHWHGPQASMLEALDRLAEAGYPIIAATDLADATAKAREAAESAPRTPRIRRAPKGASTRPETDAPEMKAADVAARLAALTARTS